MGTAAPTTGDAKTFGTQEIRVAVDQDAYEVLERFMRVIGGGA